MDRVETLEIMRILKAAYPNYYKDMTKADAEGIVDLWATMFADEPVGVVAAAVKAHISSDAKGFPPHIGAIKNAIAKLMQPEMMTEQEAAAIVLRAAANGSYGAEEEFDKLPPVLQRLVGSPSQLKEWAAMEADAVQSVVASNLQRSYREIAQREREMLTLPSDVRQTMEQLAAGKTLQLEAGR